MSVYRPAKSRFWAYDFVYQGRRFHGSTGQVTRRAAETVERQKRLEAATGQYGAVARMTFDEAAGRWWTEVGIRRGDAVDVERRVDALIKLVGKATPLAEIDQAFAARLIEIRRGQGRARSPKKGAKVYMPSNATVNRDIVETLRPILKRARTHWSAQGAHGLPDIDWRDLRLTEPRAVSRLYTTAERLRWIDACDEDLRLALELLLTYGLRFGELFFPPAALAALDTDEPTLTLQKGRKRDVLLVVPLRLDHARALAARVSRAEAASLDHLWYFEGRKGPELYARHQVEYRISKAADVAGVAGDRRIHGARHHAGSTILRRTGGNLKAVQGLLGHASISSSQRYAHVLTTELRAALEDEVAPVRATAPEGAQPDATDREAPPPDAAARSTSGSASR